MAPVAFPAVLQVTDWHALNVAHRIPVSLGAKDTNNDNCGFALHLWAPLPAENRTLGAMPSQGHG